MPVRIRLSCGEASSLISPFVRTARRMAVERGRKSGSAAARSANPGNRATSDLNVCRTAATVSIRKAASSSSALDSAEAGIASRASQGSGSASEPKPSSEPARRYATASRTSANPESREPTCCCGASAWIARRPGALVVKPLRISFSRSNSRSCSTGRGTKASIRMVAPLPAGAECPTKSRQPGGPATPPETSRDECCLARTSRPPLGCPHLEMGCQVRGGMGGRWCHADDWLRPLAPRRSMIAFDFSHALDDRLPEISQHDEGLIAHGALVQHLPDNGEFRQSTGAAGARNVPPAALHQCKEPFLAGLHTDLFVDPPVRPRPEKSCCHRERSPSCFLCAARDGFHRARIAAAANNKSFRREGSPERLRLRITCVTLTRPRAPEDRNDLGL